MKPPVKIGVLASHRGSNLQAIMDGCSNGAINGQVTVVISNNSSAQALERARTANIPTYHISGKTHPDPEDMDQAIVDALLAEDVELVVTAGYMKKLGPRLLSRFQRAIVNVHPSLLPKHGGPGMYGMKVHEAVLAAGDIETGVSVHWVDGDYDTGPVISQQVVPVFPDDTAVSLAQRVLDIEHPLLVNTLARLTVGSAES